MDSKITVAPENELTPEEVTEYYKSDEKITNEKFKFDFNIDDSLAEEIHEFEQPGQSRLLFASACIFAASLFLCTAFVAGTNLSSGSTQTSIFLEQLRTVSTEYHDALEKKKELTEEVSKLSDKELETQSTASSIDNFETAKKALDEKLELIKDDVQKKSDELNEINNDLNGASSQSITLTPGVYVVGVNMPEGAFSVTGNGSMLAATIAKETAINMQLSDSPNVVTLKSGYTVKINCTAVFTPYEE